MVQGEFERFAIDEARRCRAVEPVVNATVKNTGLKKDDQAVLADWYGEYCGSCTREVQGMSGL